MTIILKHINTDSFSHFQFSYNITCACWVYMLCFQRWAVYICLSWNKYHVLFCL